MMNDDELLRLFADAIETGNRHRISLDFKCAKCGAAVTMTMHPASPSKLPWPMFVVCCGCMASGWTEDPEMTPERWADIVRSKGEQ